MTGKNVVLLCGRGGSASIRDKNVFPILGRPLMAYPALAAKAAKRVDDHYLTTDSDKLKAVGRELGFKIIDRPPELATATSQHVDTLIHAINVLNDTGITLKYLVVIMCNCGIYRPGIIDEGIGMLDEHPDADSAVTGFIDNDHHPYRVKRVREDGTLDTWVDMSSLNVSTNRQDLPPCVILDHSMWVLRVATCFPPSGQKPWTFMGNKILFINNEACRDVHTHEDISYTERYLRAQGWQEAETETR